MGPLLCPVFFWGETCQIFYVLSFSYSFCLFSCLSSIVLEILKIAYFPKIYDALLKPYSNIAPKQFFKGVVHEQPWSAIVWLLCGSSIVSSFFLGGMNIVQKPFSFPIAFVSYFFQFSWHPLLGLYGASLGSLWDFHHNSMNILWWFYGISRRCPWNFNGILVGFQRGIYGVSIGFLGISMGFLWESYGVPWYFYWISKTRFQQDFCGI